MTCLLHVSASACGTGSFSLRIAAELIDAIGAASPGLAVIHRDLGTMPQPHPDRAFVAASLMPAAERGESEDKALAVSETLITEIENSNMIVISTPMHNFTVPSALKSWIDHVVRPGRTFRSTSAGKQGLISDRPVFVVVACGGRFGEAPPAQTDFLTPYLRYVLETIGLSRLQFIRVDELGRSPERVAAALQAASKWIVAGVSSA